MSKSRKKRNKPYTGEDAAAKAPHVRRYSVPERSTRSEWWHEHKRKVMIRAVAVAFAVLVAWLIYTFIT